MARGNTRSPATFTAHSFTGLCDAILSKRVKISMPADEDTKDSRDARRKEKQKLYWFAAPMKDPQGQRIVENMAACAFGFADIDKSTPGAMKKLGASLSGVSALIYTTASHTLHCPRMRLVYEFSRMVEPGERTKVCVATESLVMIGAGFTHAGTDGLKSRWELGEDYVIFDRSIYGEQSYVYCPDAGAHHQRYEGEAIDVDALPLPVTPPKAKKAASTANRKKTVQGGNDFEDLDDADIPPAPDEFTLSDLRDALMSKHWQNPSDDYDTWVANGLRLASLKGTEYEDGAEALWLEYSARSPANIAEFTAEKWEGFVPERGSYRGVFSASQDKGWVNPATERAKSRLMPRVERRETTTPAGLYYVTPKVNKFTGEIEEPAVWLCSPLDILGRGNDGGEEYLVLSWDTHTGSVTQAIPMGVIGEKEGWTRLKSGGLAVTAKRGVQAELADYLQLSGDKTRWDVAKVTGWQHGAYILPNGEIIGEPKTPVIFSGHSGGAVGYTVKGTPESWRDSVARLANGNPSMMLAIAAAFAAPLLDRAKQDGFGVHLHGRSSAGKTTTANTAASVYGCPDKTKLTWNSTALGVVNEAAAHNDGFMSLDEIGQSTNRRAVRDSAYALFNGVSKLQGRREGGNRDISWFKVLVLSTGETDLESFIREEGQQVKAGQLVRLLNIPLTVASQFHELADGAAHARAITKAYQANFGAVGRTWLAWLVDNRKSVEDAFNAAQTRWGAITTARNGGGQVGRVANSFAILEAALMLSLSLTGWRAEDCRAAVEHSFDSWLSNFGTGDREQVQLAEMVETFLLSQRSRFTDIDAVGITAPTNRAGWVERGKTKSGGSLYYVIPGVFRDEIIRGSEPKEACKTLHEAGVLHVSDGARSGGRWTMQKRTVEGKQNVYVLSTRPVSGADDDADADADAEDTQSDTIPFDEAALV